MIRKSNVLSKMVIVLKKIACLLFWKIISINLTF